MQQANSGGGVLGFLDGLLSTAVNASAAVSQVKANLKGPATSDQSEVAPISSLQSAAARIPTVWLVGGGLAVVVVLALVLRK